MPVERKCMWWVNASPPSATAQEGWNRTGNAGSDAQKRVHFNSQALACDQGPSTSTLLTLHHTSQLWAQPTSFMRTLRQTAWGAREDKWGPLVSESMQEATEKYWNWGVKCVFFNAFWSLPIFYCLNTVTISSFLVHHISDHYLIYWQLQGTRGQDNPMFFIR